MDVSLCAQFGFYPIILYVVEVKRIGHCMKKHRNRILIVNSSDRLETSTFIVMLMPTFQDCIYMSIHIIHHVLIVREGD